MASVRIPDLPLISGSVDPAQDRMLIYNASGSLRNKDASLQISRLLDLNTTEPLTGSLYTLTGNLNLSLQDPDFIALNPNQANRQVFLPPPDPAKLKVFSLFTTDLTYQIEVFVSGSTTLLVTMGSASLVSNIRAFSIENDWYIIRGLSA